jgi:hypothetical protein
MDISEEEQVIAPREQETQQVFRFVEWLEHFPLNRWNVLDYFKHSVFYDKSCNNERIAMQGQDLSHLQSLSGIEYVPVCEGFADECPYYLIYKQDRTVQESSTGETTSTVELLCVYYVVGRDDPGDPADNRPPLARGTVFPMPDLNLVLAHNLSSAVHSLTAALDSLQELGALEAQTLEHDEESTEENAVAALPVSHTAAETFMTTFMTFNETMLQPLVAEADKRRGEALAVQTAASEADDSQTT